MHFFPFSSVPMYFNCLMWLKWGRLKWVGHRWQSKRSQRWNLSWLQCDLGFPLRASFSQNQAALAHLCIQHEERGTSWGSLRIVKYLCLRLADIFNLFSFLGWGAFFSCFRSSYLLATFKLLLFMLCFTDSVLLRHQRRSQRKSSAADQTGSSAAGFRNTVSCQRRDCGTLGSTMLEGYCQNCFIIAQNQRFQEARRTEEQLVRQTEVSMNFSKSFSCLALHVFLLWEQLGIHTKKRILKWLHLNYHGKTSIEHIMSFFCCSWAVLIKSHSQFRVVMAMLSFISTAILTAIPVEAIGPTARLFYWLGKDFRSYP